MVVQYSVGGAVYGLTNRNNRRVDWWKFTTFYDSSPGYGLTLAKRRVLQAILHAVELRLPLASVLRLAYFCGTPLHLIVVLVQKSSKTCILI